MPVADAPPRPPITQDPIVFDARRIAQTREYAKRHYGFKRARLRDPKVIVIHYTASSTYSSVFNTFNQNVADVEFGETPQVCSHYVIDPRGRIHQLVSLKWICRHTVGLNYTAIGIEHVGTSADQVARQRPDDAGVHPAGPLAAGAPGDPAQRRHRTQRIAREPVPLRARREPAPPDPFGLHPAGDAPLPRPAPRRKATTPALSSTTTSCVHPPPRAPSRRRSAGSVRPAGETK